MSGSRMPPRFVPTLTVVIEPSPNGDADAPAFTARPVAPVADPGEAVAIGPAPLSDGEIFGLEEHLLQRVLQRVDRALDERVSDAVASVVQAQLDAMVPMLRAEIEGVLRALVAESLAAELSEHQGSTPFSPL